MLNANVAFQPIVCSSSGIRKAYEVLARFPGENGQFEGPHGLIAVGQWAALDLTIIEKLATWVAMGNRLRHPLYINVSAETLACDDAFGAWEAQYSSFQIYEKTPVMLEINESVCSDTIDKRWARLTECGLGLALDDFGSQNASLARLKSYPWSACKFESQSLLAPESQAALCYARTNKIVSIVERIETAQQAHNATQAGISLHQGFYYSPPQVVALNYAVTMPTILLSEVV